MLKKLLFSTLFIAALGTTAAVAKQSKGPLLSEMNAYVVSKTKAGKEVLKSAKKAEPGQVIEYQMTYTNKGKKKLGGLAVTGPVPANTVYVDKSARTANKATLVVSIDGGKTFEKPPVKRQKKNKQGKMETYIVPAKKYTHLRWRVQSPLKAGAKQLYSYRVKVK